MSTSGGHVVVVEISVCEFRISTSCNYANVGSIVLKQERVARQVSRKVNVYGRAVGIARVYILERAFRQRHF